MTLMMTNIYSEWREMQGMQPRRRNKAWLRPTANLQNLSTLKTGQCSRAPQPAKPIVEAERLAGVHCQPPSAWILSRP